MRDENQNISRRGLLRGDWVKQILNRGAEEIAKEEDTQVPEFLIKKPQGQSRSGAFVHRPPHAVSESEFVVGCTERLKVRAFLLGFQYSTLIHSHV
jgi:hypothetical protein